MSVAANITVQGIDAPLATAHCVVANILAGPLIELAPKLTAACETGGHLLLSGLLKTQAYAVKAAYASGFDMVQVIERDEWCCIYARRHPSVFTQCSKCETVFKLSAEVLRAAGGQVRCGKCGEVFNALAHLAEDPSVFTTSETEFDLEARADSILESPAPPTPRRAPRTRMRMPRPALRSRGCKFSIGMRRGV